MPASATGDSPKASTPARAARARLAELAAVPQRRTVDGRATDRVCPQHLPAPPAFRSAHWRCSACNQVLADRERVRADLERFVRWYTEVNA
jgi:hypothetical protein